MSTYLDKPLSLIERKKAQWAREREELAGLSAPWGCLVEASENSRTRNVTKLATTTSNADLFSRRDSNASRRQSLPPIYRNQNQTNDKFDKEMGGETSGYGSDNPNNTPEYLQQQTWNTNLGYESSSSARDDRAKWGDRGVGVGKFWDPQDIKYTDKMDDTPGWVKRGLQGETELIVSNTSPAESPEQDYGENNRPYTSSSMSQTRTYIRGQNNPVDPVELAERERKRQLARAHQEAIKEQLADREKRRREERERQIREEREEELRIEREQEIERQRREREQLILMEKQERERKRKVALQQAIQLAEKEAQEQKMKHRMMKQVNINISENVVAKEKIVSPRPIGSNIEEDTTKNNFVKTHKGEKEEVSNSQILDKQNKPNNVSYISNHTNTVNNNNHINNVNEKKENNINRNCVAAPIDLPSVPQAPAAAAPPPPPPAQPPPPQQQQPMASQPIPPRPNVQENIMVLQTPFESGFSTMPFAILMPTYNPGPTTPLPIAAPMQVNNPVDQTPRPRTENRILTPTQYRNRRFCDSSTQTDSSPTPHKSDTAPNKEIKYLREKFVNMEVNFEERTRKESRSRTSERNPNDKPKWGANRPPTRYMKQSEKDPFYHRKKSRQKIVRQIKLYDDKNNNYSQHSSDDSQTVTPRTYRKKGYIEKRRTRALWQKNEHMFARNVEVYQTEIVPLETDKDHIYYKKSECIKCCCDCRSKKHKYSDEVKVVDILKIEHTPREDVEYTNNEGCLPECNNSSIDSEVLEKLNSLHSGLMMKQEQWQNSPCTPSLCSPRRTTETNG